MRCVLSGPSVGFSLHEGEILQRVLVFLLLSLLIGPVASVASNKDPASDQLSITEYQKECLNIKKLTVRNSFPVDCYRNYHHFNSGAFKSKYSKGQALKKGRIKIASYNMLHPGSRRSMFKDKQLMARMMNDWDIIIALELLPTVGRHAQNNKKVLAWLNSSGSLTNLKVDRPADVEKLFRAPGYLEMLIELRRLDSSWALILAPRADSAKSGNVEELVGFYYRATRVRPVINEHCAEYKNKGDGEAFACLPNLRKSFMGRDTTAVFSRRPFLASFESGNFDFSLLGSHLIFGSPRDEEEMKAILGPSFGVAHYKDLGKGSTLKTYARLAEAAVTLELMENLKKHYQEQSIILGADFNLTPELTFWKRILGNSPGAKLFQKLPTTVTHKKADAGVATNGFSSSYDHFIFNPEDTEACTYLNGRAKVSRVNTYIGRIGRYIKNNYIIREKGALAVSYRGKKRRKKQLAKFKKYLKSIYTIKNGRIEWDDYQFEKRVEAYDTRLFKSQLSNSTYYKVYQELLSDHMPIVLKCNTK